jgi:hypothetical protein
VILLPFLTIRTGSTRPRWIHGDTIANGKPARSPAECYDFAGDLMAEDHRLLEPDYAESTMAKVVQIGAADPTSANSDPDLSWTRLHRLALFDPKVLCLMDNESFHSNTRGGKDNQCQPEFSHQVSTHAAVVYPPIEEHIQIVLRPQTCRDQA